MPTIQYSNNPNVDTAFVVQDGGQKNRAVLTAPQDTSTIEYSDNPNSTKAYVTVDGKKHRVILTADATGSGGGSSTDYTKVVSKTTSMPIASADNLNIIYMYDGTTNANYTHGYVYENKKTATYTGTVSFEPATLSGTTATCSGDDFATFLTEAGADPTPIVSGTMTYDAGATGWRLVGKDAEDNTVTSFIEYNEDYSDAGFTFTGTPVDGDVIAFTCTVEEDVVTYTWTRIDVQPAPEALPDQTGNSGKFLTTDGANPSWSNKPLVNMSTASNTIYVDLGHNTTTYTSVTALGAWAVSGGDESVSVGYSAKASTQGVSVGARTTSNGLCSINIGYRAHTDYANNAIMINASGTTQKNEDSNTVKIANANGNYEIMSADGTIPTARLTKVNTTITLVAANWSSNTQTVSVTGMTATGIVFVNPDPTDQVAYTAAGIICSAQAADSLTFTCGTTPTTDIDVVIVML